MFRRGGERQRRKVALGSKPHLLVGTLVGTLATYVAFVWHYTHIRSEDNIWVWNSIRSDGRCGRDFTTDWGTETTCGKGHCCSSHGWCGHGEEYCSVAMGCQNGCWAASKEDEAKRDADERYRHHHDTPDDDEYNDKMRHYRYDEDYGDHYRHHGGGYGRYHGYRGGYHDDDYADYHHRYDDDTDSYYHRHDDPLYHEHGGGYDHHDHHDIEHEHDDTAREHYGDDAHEEHHNEEGGGGAEGGAEGGPELVGLSEKRHLGTGDGVPLPGESPGAEAAAPSA